jgi:predicted SAM-dependent methyltransferase
MKLHLGAGSVYLRGYINMDLPGPHMHLAADRPDLVSKWETTDDDYFARHRDKTIESLAAGPLDQECVCDLHGSLLHIPAAAWSVDEVLLRHVFEHLSLTEAHTALDQIDGVLMQGGILRIDVPDHEETVRLLRETGNKFYERHLLGPRRNDFGFHMMSYDRTRLRNLVESHGFVFVEEEPNIHFFPAITLKFQKPGARAPRDYAWPPPYPIPDEWNVLEVGPGNYPLPRANVYLDKDAENAERLHNEGKTVIVGDIETGLPEIPDGTYDMCFISHVLEHCSQLETAIATVSRISRNGRMLVPSALKEGLFGGSEEMDHKWLILPSPQNGGSPVFVRKNQDYMQRLKDVEVEKSTSRIWRTGPNRIDEARYLRKYFYEHERDFDVVVDWDEEHPLKVVVIE